MKYLINKLDDEMFYDFKQALKRYENKYNVKLVAKQLCLGKFKIYFDSAPEEQEHVTPIFEDSYLLSRLAIELDDGYYIYLLDISDDREYIPE